MVLSFLETATFRSIGSMRALTHCHDDAAGRPFLLASDPGSAGLKTRSQRRSTVVPVLAWSICTSSARVHQSQTRPRSVRWVGGARQRPRSLITTRAVSSVHVAASSVTMPVVSAG